jgi:rRNA maturation endonuclease Nob1
MMDGFYEVMYDEEDEETYDHPDECWNCGDEWSPKFGFCQSCGVRLFDESGELIHHESDTDEWGEPLIEAEIE